MDYEKVLINSAIKAIERSIKNHDMETALVLIKLCKYIAGDKFQVTVEREGENNGN